MPPMIRPDQATLKQIPASSIDFGKNEGRVDSLERYFYDTGLVQQLSNDKKTLIIGRKGTGKTAIASHLIDLARQDANTFARILSFRDVPVKLLESFEDKDHASSSRFSRLWKLVILTELAKLVLTDEKLHPNN
jgi:DNA-binding NtrC family response regulator